MKLTREMKLQAEDITCTACAEDMEKILLETDGIIDARVDYNDDTIFIKYDPDVIDRKHVYIAARRIGKITNIISEA